MWRSISHQLGLNNVLKIKVSPDKPNMSLQRARKPSHRDIYTTMLSVFPPELLELEKLGASYPVTLLYMPLEWCACAQMEAIDIFGLPQLEESKYAIYFSSQVASIKDYVIAELKKENPQLRLVFCTLAIGMGFDSPSITRVIHTKPPRRAVDFMQQIGRAGRKGQPACSKVFFNSNDIGQVDIEQAMKDYCTSDCCMCITLLKAFSFSLPSAKNKGRLFQELVLVLGRKSSRSNML
jgi:ATP-dependent DNA helicase RecQ